MATEIETLIEKARPTSGPAAHHFPDDWARYERAALVALQRMGVERLIDAGLRGPERERWEALLYESCVWTIGRVRTGCDHEALRGLLQMSAYCARIGGFWPVAMGDAYIALQNHLERALRRAADAA